MHAFKSRLFLKSASLQSMRLKDGSAMSRTLVIEDLDKDTLERIAAQNAKRNATRDDKRLLLNNSSLQHLSIVETRDLDQLSQIISHQDLYDRLYLRNQELEVTKEDEDFMNRQFRSLQSRQKNRAVTQRKQLMARHNGRIPQNPQAPHISPTCKTRQLESKSSFLLSAPRSLHTTVIIQE